MPRLKKESINKENLEVSVYNWQGEVVAKKQLASGVFDVQVSPALIHQVVVAQQANARGSYAHTKTKGEVRGGGRKPWKQKGTGRARHGSSRSPIWKGGGVTFGPRNDRNYTQKVNRKAIRRALCAVLSERLSTEHFMFVDNYTLKAPKTKEANLAMTKLPNLMKPKKKAGEFKTVGLILPTGEAAARRAFRNIPFVRVMSTKSLNVLDLMGCNTLVMSTTAVEEVEKLFISVEKE